jgi:hypothetical protein
MVLWRLELMSLFSRGFSWKIFGKKGELGDRLSFQPSKKVSNGKKCVYYQFVEDGSEEQKEYIYTVCSLFGLNEDMEECFSTRKDKDEVIKGLKEFGFEQVEPWW